MAPDPTQIGRYKILGTLGQGAMGKVYLAEDPALKRGLAIKVMQGYSGDKEVLARFKREAEISARLNHPNIITIFDVGEDPGFGPFLAMEFVDGEGLDAFVKAGRMEPQEAMPLLLQAGNALEAIHRAGIVHRDVKPSNFMVGKDGRLKLMDFGIARGDEPRLTTTAAFLGTPAYAAPETLAGLAKPSEAADRWALAVTAFEMLTGLVPFAADSVNAVLYRVAHEPPQFPDGMEPGLRAVFERALAKDPGKRHESEREFLKALAGALPMEAAAKAAFLSQVGSPAATGTYRLPGRASRFRKRALIAGLSLLAVGAGAWLAWAFTGRTRVVGIYSTPPGARVLMDGVELGRTPLPQVVIRGHAGKLRVEKPDYLPLERTLASDEDRLDLKLSPAPFPVQVVTEPAGAEVRLDGRSMGTAPLEIQVPGEGRHTLEVSMGGYEPWNTVLNRHGALPDPIRLRRRGAQAPAKESKVKKFFKGLLDK